MNMEFEISLTRKLTDELNLKNLEPSTNDEPSLNHFYADLIIGNKKKAIMFLNTENSWICMAYLKFFKLDPLHSFINAISDTLFNEGLTDYVPGRFINDITNIKFSSTNNKSTVARMSARKKDICSFYETYIGVPDPVILHYENKFNAWLCKNPFSKGYMDYIYPWEEMGYILVKKYQDKVLDLRSHNLYIEELDELFPTITSPISYENRSIQDIEIEIKSLNQQHYLVSPYLIKNFYEEHKNPSIEDYFDFIYSLHCPSDPDGNLDVEAYLDLFGLDKRMYKLYTEFHYRHYKTEIYKN